MLADGNLGQLFLDFNNWGQRFDGLVFNPHELVLSTYDPAVPDPYLGVSGPVCFPFFGLHQVNIRDAQAQPAARPAPPRHVTVPKTPITPHAAPTELALSGTWHDVNSNDLAVFDCLEVDVDYNVASQNGFLGTGTGELSFLHSDPLDITVEIHSDATDIHISSTDTHDIDLGLYARLGGIAQIAGCARIEGPTLARLTHLRDPGAERRRRIDLRPEGGLRDRDRHLSHPDHVRLLRVGRHAAVRRARRPRGLGDRAPPVRLRDGVRRGRAVRPRSTATRWSPGCPAKASSRGTSARPCSTCRAG